MSKPIHIKATGYTPEVLIYTPENKIYLNFQDDTSEMSKGFLPFFNPIFDFIKSTYQATQKINRNLLQYFAQQFTKLCPHT